MKRLILHIGFPKTASTTLQEGLFLNLHKIGKINFLGRTVTSSHKKIFSKGFGQDWVVDFKRYFIMGKKLPRNNYELSDTLLNVISDEDLTLPAIFNEIQHGLKRDPLSFIYTLKEILSDAEEVIVLMTIRNQSELIPSCYSQKFGHISLHRHQLSFEKFVKGADGEINSDTFRAFNFDGVAMMYAKVFKAKVVPIFFEDLKNDKHHFFKQIGSVLNLNGDDLIDMIGNAHFRNKKEAQDSGVYRTVYFPNKIGRLINRLFGKDPSRSYLDKHWYIRTNAIIIIINRLYLSKITVAVPPFDDEIKFFIKSSFSDSNLLFCKKFGLDIEKFRKYNYL